MNDNDTIECKIHCGPRAVDATGHSIDDICDFVAEHVLDRLANNCVGFGYFGAEDGKTCHLLIVWQEGEEDVFVATRQDLVDIKAKDLLAVTNSTKLIDVQNNNYRKVLATRELMKNFDVQDN